MANRWYPYKLAFHYGALLASCILVFGDWLDSRAPIGKWLAVGLTMSVFFTYSREARQTNTGRVILGLSAGVFAFALLTSLRFSKPQIPLYGAQPVWQATTIRSTR